MDNYVDHINGIPLTTSVDGNCLFNAVSISLCGNKTKSLKLRYHTCINLVTRWDQYQIHPQRPQLRLLCSSYLQSCLDSTIIGKFSNVWTIIALTNAINMKIRVIYPYANGTNDIAYKTVNNEFKSSGAFDNRQQLAIIWYKSGHVPTPGPGKWYDVNHFAAVIHLVHKLAYLSTYDNAVDYGVCNKRRLCASSSVSSTGSLTPKSHCSNVFLMSTESEFSSSNNFDTLQELTDAEETDKKEVCFTPKKTKLLPLYTRVLSAKNLKSIQETGS
ncbi:hypothetical protein ACJMK2_028778 [Sinanodonta woodiana]|uniref:OTU domain-containing protein n=1 Tax=Sinanodonta woodiana TaxID=1069815 RepID=A0ABD3X855_SINWO